MDWKKKQHSPTDLNAKLPQDGDKTYSGCNVFVNYCTSAYFFSQVKRLIASV